MRNNRSPAALLRAALVLACVAGIAASACSPYVFPCHCGLCPRIVDCATKQSAECFCGTVKQPGSYPHPTDLSKFWHCSFDAATQIAYGVELACPGRLMYDAVTGVCTVPSAVTAAASPAAAGPAQVPAAAAATSTPAAATSSTPAAAAAVVAKKQKAGSSWLRVSWADVAPQAGGRLAPASRRPALLRDAASG